MKDKPKPQVKKVVLAYSGGTRHIGHRAVAEGKLWL